MCDPIESASNATNDDLASFLNRRVGLAGADKVTVDVIRQWVAWQVLPKATATASKLGESPKWTRAGSDIMRAVRLAECRRLGLRRRTAVIAQAYMEWGHPDVEAARSAILAELRRARSTLRRKLSTNIDFDDFSMLSSAKKQAISTQSGPLDPRILGTQFQQEAETYALILQAATIGSSSTARIGELLMASVERISPILAPLAENPIFATTIISSFEGIFGDPEEIDNSGESLIEKASARDFALARRITMRIINTTRVDLPQGLAERDAGLKALFKQLTILAPQISQGPWVLLLFVLTLAIGKSGWQRIASAISRRELGS